MMRLPPLHLSLLLALTLGLATAASSSSSQGEMPEPMRLEGDWQLYLPLPGETLTEPPDSGWLLWEDSPANATDGLEEAWLRLRLPESLPRDHTRLVFRTFRTRFTLYLDRESLYDYGQGEPRAASLEAHVVRIPRDAAGRWLVVRVPRPDLADVSPRAWQLVAPTEVPVALSRALRDRLVDDIPKLVIAILTAGVGVLALAISLFRRKKNERVLLYFGIFTLLYAVRLIINNDLSFALGLPLDRSRRVEALIGYVINIPGWLFFLELFGVGRGNSIRWSVRVLSVFALIGVLSDLVQDRAFSMVGLHNVVVILAILVLLANVVQIRRTLPADFRILAGGSIALALLGINNNLVPLGLVPWQWTEESIGFFVFVCCLGLVVARQVFATESALVAIESELETARRIQETLLPEAVPDIPGLQVVARYQPMSQVAGDLYDFSTPSPTRVGLLIADVAGHGAPAALIASMVKVAFTTEEPHWNDPARLMAGMNHTLCGNLPSGFVTAIYATLDEGGSVAVANGGHPHPLAWRRASGKLEELPAQGTLLGRFREATFGSSEHRLEPGDRLLLFTDGMVEATRPGEDEPFGEARLGEALAATSELDLDRAADQLLDTLRQWRGNGDTGFDDDLTLLLVARDLE